MGDFNRIVHSACEVWTADTLVIIDGPTFGIFAIGAENDRNYTPLVDRLEQLFPSFSDRHFPALPRK